MRLFRIVYYDSYGNVDSKLYLNATLRWLQEMAISVRKVSLTELSGGEKWALYAQKGLHQQGNGTDCGIYAMMNICCLTFLIPLHCCTENAKLCRQRIALSLIQQQLF